MRLEVILFAGLKCNNPTIVSCRENEFYLEVPDGMTIKELRALLGIDPAMPLLTMVNNHHEQEEWVLTHDDRVAMFPPIGGG